MRRFLLFSIVCACSSNGNSGLPPVVPTDLGALDVVEEDTGRDSGTVDMLGDASVVQLSLTPYTEDPPDPAETVRVYQVTAESELLEGEVALGKVGDYILENGTAKFLIEGPTRNMNPCPWGGNVLDAVYLKGDTPPEDIVGEICLFMNASLTLKPDRFDIASAPNGAGVLAVSGNLTLGDFINLKSMIDDLAPGFGDRIGIDTEFIPNARLTVYYILRPGDNGLQVATAIRNDGTELVHLLGNHIMASGGDGYYFNPLNSNKGFGASGLDVGNLQADPVPFLAFNGERSSYAYLPKPVAGLGEARDLPFPVGGSNIVISGVAATLLGSLDILGTLLAPKATFETTLPGVLHIEPGDISVLDHVHYVGNGSLSTMIDPMYERLGVATGSLTGKVLEDDGTPAVGARVSAIDSVEDRTYNQTITDAQGNYAMRVPFDKPVVLSARNGLRPPAITQTIFTALDNAVADLTLAAPSSIRVNTTRADGSATPARVTIVCEGPCQQLPTMRERDVAFHQLPSDMAAIEYTGVDGIANIELPGGHDYRVVVSRGMEWSIWPDDALSSGGQLVTLNAGEEVVLDVELAHVIDSPNAISADFHIHTIGSPDSTVAHIDRVKNFLAEGVDVMVTTDHDIITDFAPAIEALGAGAEITSMIGEEVTTSDLGHFNAFPVVLDNDVNRRGGALDWGGGDGVGLTPSELFAALDAHPGEQVIQVNHAAGLGLIAMTQADVLRQLTFADREVKRLPLEDPDPVSGDTGLWSDGFTAIELLNGNSQSKFWELAHWWMLMIGRGFSPTGTGVTDTHKLYSDLGGVPRTYTFVDPSISTPSTFDQTDFVSQVNAGRAIGTNGPYFEVTFENNNNETGTFGDTIATNGEPVVAHMTIQVPSWIDVSAIDVYVNPPYADVKADSGEVISDAIPPTQTVPVVWTANEEEIVAGVNRDHVRRRQTIDIPLTTADDAFVIFIVRGAANMYPIVGSSAFSFSNPAFLDADGNGYDNPPYEAESMMLPPDVQMVTRELTTDEALEQIVHGLDCEGH